MEEYYRLDRALSSWRMRCFKHYGKHYAPVFSIVDQTRRHEIVLLGFLVATSPALDKWREKCRARYNWTTQN